MMGLLDENALKELEEFKQRFDKLCADVSRLNEILDKIEMTVCSIWKVIGEEDV